MTHNNNNDNNQFSIIDDNLFFVRLNQRHNRQFRTIEKIHLLAKKIEEKAAGMSIVSLDFSSQFFPSQIVNGFFNAHFV